MKQTTGGQIKNAAIFILSATLLVALMIFGPSYLESCLQDTPVAEAARGVSIATLSGTPVTLNSEYFEWNVSIDNLYGGNSTLPAAPGEFYSLSMPLPSFNTHNKMTIDLVTQADATIK